MGTNHSHYFARLRRKPIKRGVPHTLPGKLVVSLTSYPRRYETLDLTLRTLLSQDMAPDELVLWIAHEDRASLPRRVEALQDHGLTIRTCEDFKSYKKLIPALASYPGAYIVTADDDRRYPRNWLRRFVEEYSSPNEILCQEAYRIVLDLDGRLLPYNEWPSLSTTRGPTDTGGPGIFPIGSEGVLYPPGAFIPEAMNVAEALRLCPHGDDIWNYWMTRPDIRRRLIKHAGKLCDEWPGTVPVGLWLTSNINGGNDRQIAAMIEAYGLPFEFSRAHEETRVELSTESTRAIAAGTDCLSRAQSAKEEAWNADLVVSHRSPENPTLAASKVSLRSADVTTKGYRYNASDAGLEGWPSEAAYLAVVKQMTIDRPNARYLDVGSGLGRIIDIVKHNVGSLVGLEPDPERYLACYNGHHDDARIRILNMTMQEYAESHPSDRFDIIAVSQVLPHVSRATCHQILRNVRELLDSGGKAIIATTHAPAERFYYADDNASKPAEEFDDYAMDVANQRYGIPVRRFSRVSLCQAITDAGLAIEQWDQFSFVPLEKAEAFARLLNIPRGYLRHMGISQYVIAKIGG